MKLGRKRPISKGPHLRLANYLTSALPPAPASVDYSPAAAAALAEMYLNDQLGDCLPEGVIVAPGKVNRVVRGCYDGPIVVLTTASGKRLPVTPNHAVLTDAGFQRARLLQKGDNLVCASRPEIFPGAPRLRRQAHINQSPTAIDKIFSTGALSGQSVSKVMPVAVNFHGDERFLDGDVDIIGAESFLRRKLYAALRKPHAENKIGAARQLQRHFASAGTAFLRGLRGFASAFGDIGISSYRPAFSYSHSGVAQSEGLGLSTKRMTSARYRSFEAMAANSGLSNQLLKQLAVKITGYPRSEINSPIMPPSAQSDGFAVSPDLYASIGQPTADGHFTDTSLSRNLQNAFPGLIEVDSIIDINFQRYKGHIYDLSTDQRWYSANGIITHNCVIAAMGHIEGVLTGNGNPPALTYTDAQITALYSAIGGYVPGDPNTDQGCDEVTALNYWQASGAPAGSHKIAGWLAVDSSNRAEYEAALWLFENLFFGVELPDAWINPEPTGSGFVWDVAGAADPNNGHAFAGVAYNAQGVKVATWGMEGLVTHAAIGEYCANADGGELYVVISQDSVNRASQKAPSGFNWSQLVADFDAIGGHIAPPPAPPSPTPPNPAPPPPPSPAPVMSKQQFYRLVFEANHANFRNPAMTAKEDAEDIASICKQVTS